MNKDLKYLLILVGLIFLSLGILVVVNMDFSNKIEIVNDKKIWESYDNNMSNVKSIMDSITDDSDTFIWWSLKDVKLKDESYIRFLNQLVADVRMTYLNLTSDIYTDSNIMSNYRDKTYIYKSDLVKINNGLSSDNMDFNISYDNFLITDNEERRDKFINAINEYNEILDSELFKNREASYEDNVLKSYILSLKLEDLAEFLESEYNLYKKN